VNFDRLYTADPQKNPNPMRRYPSVSLSDKTTQTIFDHVQFPVNYWFPQDHRGVVDRVSFGHGVVVQLDFEFDVQNVGKYFTYSYDAFKAYFGASATISGTVFNVKQCRNRQQIWEGQIMVFAAAQGVNTGWTGAGSSYGRYSSTASRGDWQTNDIIVKSTDVCNVSRSCDNIGISKFLVLPDIF
jgi:hypothetical protein